MIGVWEKVKVRNMSLPLLVVDIVSEQLVVVAWKSLSGKIHELVVSKRVLEKLDA